MMIESKSKITTRTGFGWCEAFFGAEDWLRLAAAPTFAFMALVTGIRGGGPIDMFCSSGDHAFPLSGMAPMYVLMSTFHLAPWLSRFSNRSSGAGGA